MDYRFLITLGLVSAIAILVTSFVPNFLLQLVLVATATLLLWYVFDVRPRGLTIRSMIVQVFWIVGEYRAGRF